MSFDIVITWVDWSNKNFVNKLIEEGGRSEGCESGEFIELKYLLRSLEKHKVEYRKIHIVHSDNHPPPKYLKETERLSFVPHSALVTDVSHLPLIHRQSIYAHLHKIPDLTNIFFYMEDDYFIMNPIIFEYLLNNYNNKTVFVDKGILQTKYDVTKSCGLWFQSMVNSRHLIDQTISHDTYIQDTHWIQIFDKSVLQELESLYPKQFLDTQTYKNQEKEKEKEKNIICETCIFLNYLIYKKNYQAISSDKLKIVEIHTNGYNKVTQSQKVNLLNKLNKSCNAWMLNAQGNGISDEYPDCQIVHHIFYSFLENEFPIKSEMEVDDIFDPFLRIPDDIKGVINSWYVEQLTTYGPEHPHANGWNFDIKTVNYEMRFMEDVLNNGNVIDVGCGTGYYMKLLKEYYNIKNIVGVEPEYEYVKVARKYTNDTIIQSNASNLKFIKDSTFDAYISIFPNVHMNEEELTKSIYHAIRILKNNGKAYIGCVNKSKPSWGNQYVHSVSFWINIAKELNLKKPRFFNSHKIRSHLRYDVLLEKNINPLLGNL